MKSRDNYARTECVRSHRPNEPAMKREIVLLQTRLARTPEIRLYKLCVDRVGAEIRTMLKAQEDFRCTVLEENVKNSMNRKRDENAKGFSGKEYS